MTIGAAEKLLGLTAAVLQNSRQHELEKHMANKSTLLTFRPLNEGPIQWKTFFSIIGISIICSIFVSIYLSYKYDNYSLFPIICLIPSSILYSYNRSKVYGEKEFLEMHDIIFLGLQGSYVFWITKISNENNFVRGKDFGDNVGYIYFGLVYLLSLFLVRWRIKYCNNRDRFRTTLISASTKLSDVDLYEIANEVDDRMSRLDGLELFTPNEFQLRNAWDTKSAAVIESLLKHGDVKTRESAHSALNILNESGDRVDLMRGNLSRLVNALEASLACYNIQYEKINFVRSKIVAYEITPVVTIKSLPLRADMSRGLGQLGGRMATGNISWQTGIFIAIAAIIAGQIINQRALRKLKEIEGALSNQAAAVEGDIRLIHTTMETRIIPQIRALASLSTAIEGHLHVLLTIKQSSNQGGQAPEMALKSAMVLLEAKYVLKMMAGN